MGYGMAKRLRKRKTTKARREAFEIQAPGLPPIWIHYSAPLVPILLTAPLWLPFRTKGVAAAAMIVGAFMLSILAHELGHVVMARRYGRQVFRIRLHAAGGDVLFDGRPLSFPRGRRLALAGPLVNIALGALCLFAAWLLTSTPTLQPTTSTSFRPPPVPMSSWLRALVWTGWINMALAAVNLLPAYPLDGGRIAHSLVEERWGRGRALYWIGLSGAVLSGVSTLVLVVSTLAGTPIWSPPHPRPNLAAMRAGRRRPSQSDG
jgi:Zn-dependent protease